MPQRSACVAPISVQGSTTTSTAVANVHVSMDQKVSMNLHGTTTAFLSLAVGEAQCCAGLDDAILFKMDAGPLQRLAHGDHREVSVEFNRFFEAKRRLQEQRRTSEGHRFVSRSSGGKVVWMGQKQWCQEVGGDWYQIRNLRTCDWDSWWDGYEQSEGLCHCNLQKEYRLTGSSP